MKYHLMPTACDLTEATFNWAMGQSTPPFYLHVHPFKVKRAQSIVDAPAPPGRRNAPIHVVADDELNENEWYIVTAIGSNPA
jgi:hypothetical protein